MAKTRLVLFLGYLKEWDVNQWCHHDHTGALCFSGHLPEWHNWYHLPLVNCTFELLCFWDFAIDSLHCNSGYSWLWWLMVWNILWVALTRFGLYPFLSSLF
jgi:hypothetical protein